MGRGPGSIPLVGKRAFYIELMKTGISNSEACRRVGVERKTGVRWQHGRRTRPPARCAEVTTVLRGAIGIPEQNSTNLDSVDITSLVPPHQCLRLLFSTVNTSRRKNLSTSALELLA
jgi:hypothetical protein